MDIFIQITVLSPSEPQVGAFFYSNAGKVYCQTCLVMALLEKICQLNLVHNHLVAVPDREQKGYTYYIIYFKLWILLCCIISLANDSVDFSLFP